MVRRYHSVMAGAVLALLLLALWLFSLLDAVTSPKESVRILPKLVWVIVIVVGSVPGAVLWLFLGRPRKEYVAAEVAPSHPDRPRVIGPEDAPDFEERLQRGLRLQQEHPPDDL